MVTVRSLSSVDMRMQQDLTSLPVRKALDQTIRNIITVQVGARRRKDNPPCDSKAGIKEPNPLTADPAV
eukprot:13543-Eustigmatos_ZCMA.PRE.1